MRIGGQEVEVEGLAELEGRLANIVHQLGNAGPLFRTLGNILVRDALEAFKGESWHGAPWAPLADATTQASYPPGTDRVRGGGNILHPTGQSIMQTISILDLGENFVEVGTPTAWTHVHNYGADLQNTAFGNITIPQRQFLGLHEDNIEMMMSAVSAWLWKAVG